MSVFYCEDRLTILRGDAADLPLPDASVDLIVTSPPYFGLRSYKDGGEHYDGQVGAEATPAEFVAALLRCTREWVRVLKPSGSLWVNLGDKYSGNNTRRGTHGGAASVPVANNSRRVEGLPTKSLIGIPWRYALACIDDLGLILRAEVVWAKPNGLPESVTDRVRRSHEQWFHFTKEPRYYSNVDAVREPHTSWEATARRKTQHNKGSKSEVYGGSISSSDRSRLDFFNPRGKLPGSVWTIPTQPLKVPPEVGVEHFAAFPMEWPRRIIKGWCPPGGTVLDPFGGTGTTALVAWALGCHGITNDLSADYCRLAQWRTTNPEQRAKAAQTDKPEPIHPDQLTLI